MTSTQARLARPMDDDSASSFGDEPQLNRSWASGAALISSLHVLRRGIHRFRYSLGTVGPVCI